MNRRKALKNIFIFSVFTTIGVGGYKFYNLKKKPAIYLLSDYKDLIAELAETIIPATHTPGAKAANVQDFIINIITNCTGKEDQNNFIIGLQDLEQYCYSNYDLAFTDCTLTQKIETLNYFEQKDTYRYNILNKVNMKLFGLAFIFQLKSLTVQGYCMSYQGATKGLAYDFIPKVYQPCLPLQPNQKSWATK
ncbi:gluconate 2-dehydrogenase subunit 3 family protein [Pedobacter cryotolerans]|uniref:Gluconate 2-dehydrogenase subunit 3 family protein n=1 Tax=Pedobacter cryotolerans TaxID=2571270 RepID=A0A4U1C5X0_9SPHI|nr:gluconate 2-dehydrogenase subunit 3 family protein [Pedobacter cryotolerans]TKB99653.1 gluconate 2-dehydrogenase subunit 3 family protein [Pedobacter cryotolerans]